MSRPMMQSAPYPSLMRSRAGCHVTRSARRPLVDSGQVKGEGGGGVGVGRDIEQAYTQSGH